MLGFELAKSIIPVFTFQFDYVFIIVSYLFTCKLGIKGCIH